MATRRTRAKAGAKADAPAAPRVAPELTSVDVDELDGLDSWDAQRVTGALEPRRYDSLDVSDCRLDGLRAVGLEVDRLSLTDVVFEGCDLSGALLRGALLRRVEFRDSRMSGVVFDGSTFRDVRFTGCKLDGANLRMLDGDRVHIEATVLREGDLTNAKIHSGAIVGCDLRGARFAKVSAPGLRLHGSDLSEVRDAEWLTGAVIESSQFAALAGALLDSLGIRVEGDADPDDPDITH